MNELCSNIPPHLFIPAAVILIIGPGVQFLSITLEYVNARGQGQGVPSTFSISLDYVQV